MDKFSFKRDNDKKFTEDVSNTNQKRENMRVEVSTTLVAKAIEQDFLTERILVDVPLVWDIRHSCFFYHSDGRCRTVMYGEKQAVERLCNALYGEGKWKISPWQCSVDCVKVDAIKLVDT